MKEDIDSEILLTEEDISDMLDSLLQKRDAEWWNHFYLDKTKPIPFFKCIPDENLCSYIEKGYINKGLALDIGCGNGRNSIYLSKSGFIVHGIDFSQESIKWAKENARNENVSADFSCRSFFDFPSKPNTYDFIYDSGCLHHIKPHRRPSYLEKISVLLKPGGYFGLSCFNLKGGANISDYDVYQDGSMHGGMGYSEYKLKKILNMFFTVVEFREMREIGEGNLFGKDFMWAVLSQKKTK